MAELLLIEKSELRATIKEMVREAVNEELGKSVKESDFQERMNRYDAAKFLGISYQTLGKWTRSGKVKVYGTGRKAFYLKRDLMTIQPGDQWKTQL